MSQFDESKHNRATDGKFANKPHAEAAGVSLEGTQPTPESGRLPDDVIQRFEDWEATDADRQLVIDTFPHALPKSVTLLYVEYDDQLTDEQADKYLTGDDMAVYNDVMERWGDDAQYDAMRDQLKETLSDMGLDGEVVADDFQDDLSQVIYDRNDANPVPELLDHRQKDLMRFDLVSGDEWDGYSDLHRKANQSVYLKEGVAEARTELAAQALLKNGVIDQPLNAEDRARLVEAFGNGPEWLHEGVTIGALFNAPTKDAALPYEATLKPDGEVVHTIKTGGPGKIVVLDAWNGRGFDTELSTPITMNMTRNHHAHLDSPDYKAGRGYGYDEIAGVDADYYDMDLVEVPNK